MRPLGVIGHLSRDVVAGSPAQIGGGPWHAARALRALRQEAVVFAKCGDADRRRFRAKLAALGLPTAVAAAGETTAFSFSYDDAGTRSMRVDAIGEPWRVEDVPAALLRRVEWLQVAPLLRGDFDADLLAWLARGRRILLDAQGLVRRRATGPLVLDGDFDPDVLRHVTVLKLAEEEAEAVGDLACARRPGDHRHRRRERIARDHPRPRRARACALRRGGPDRRRRRIRRRVSRRARRRPQPALRCAACDRARRGAHDARRAVIAAVKTVDGVAPPRHRGGDDSRPRRERAGSGEAGRRAAACRDGRAERRDDRRHRRPAAAARDLARRRRDVDRVRRRPAPRLRGLDRRRRSRPDPLRLAQPALSLGERRRLLARAPLSSCRTSSPSAGSTENDQRPQPG